MFKLKNILSDIEFHIQNKKPFSIVRLGDGDLKILEELQTNNFSSVRSEREGYNKLNSKKLLDIYVNACNNANYISGFDLYLDNTFWRSCNPPKIISLDCIEFVSNWKQLYSKIGITNVNYCSPELGWQLFINSPKYPNLFSILKNQKFYVITCFPIIEKRLKSRGFDASVIKIPGRFQDHGMSYEEVKQEIKKCILERNIFLVGGGAWGRGYSDYIKNLGGIAIDIGKVCDSWRGGKWCRSYHAYVLANDFSFKLTEFGNEYLQYF